MNTPRTPASQPNTSDSSSPLSPAWTGALAQGLASSDTLSLQAQARIKQQLMAKIGASSVAAAAASPLIRDLRRDENWVPLGKHMQVKVLHDDGQQLSWLLKLLPGGRLPVHDHADGVEECLVMEGRLRINGVTFEAGDFQIAMPGSVHDEVASDEGALVYLRSPSSRRKDLMGA
jgi:anti-sigma factor ChrR (cupin superfamily)